MIRDNQFNTGARDQEAPITSPGGGRSIPEWIATHPDQAIPAKAKARIFLREGGRCHISGRKIGAADKLDFDHDPPLSMGGQHRESMIFPVLRDKHREKTAAEAGPRAKADRIRAKHLGIHPKPTRRLQSRGFR